MAKSKIETETAPELPELPPVPKWQDDEKYVAAATKLAELKAKQSEAEADRAKALRETGGAKYDEVEIAALRLFDSARAAELTAAFGRLKDADARAAAYRRAVELAEADESKVRTAVTRELAAEEDARIAEVERVAARRYLDFLKASGAAHVRRWQAENAGLHIPRPLVFRETNVAGSPVFHALQTIAPELIRLGHVEAAEIESIVIV